MGTGCSDVLKSTLQEEFDLASPVRVDGGVFDLLGLDLKHVNLISVSRPVASKRWREKGRKAYKFAANGESLCFGVCDPAEAFQKFLGRVHYGQVDSQMTLERLFDLLGLIQTKASVVNHDSVETIANGFVHEFCCHRGVDPAADSSENLALGSHDLSDPSDPLINKAGHGPVLPSFANFDCEVLEKSVTPIRFISL